MTDSSTPRRVLNPCEGQTVIEATAAPGRALPVAESKSSAVRVGLATLAAGAVTSAAVGVAWASTNSVTSSSKTDETSTQVESLTGTQADLPAQIDTAAVSAAREARTGSAQGATAAFVSRDGQRPDIASLAQAAATTRTQALAAATDKVTTAGVKAATVSRATALINTAANVSKEEQRRKAEGWLPGGKNPVFMRPVAGGTFTSPFGWRSNPVTGASELHTGQDIAIGCGTPILAPQDGTVTFRDYMGSGGNALKIEHGKYNGKEITSGYYHAQRYIVGVGEKVSRGQVIGYVGSTGTSTGCHLHYMIFEDGTNVDPVPFIRS